jgi:hypothetical protein
MQYIMRMEEKLLKSGSKVTGKPARNAAATQRGTNRATPTRTAAPTRSRD